MSAVTSSLDRIQSANLNADIFVGYEQTLTPFVLSDCFSRFPAWKDYASAELLSSLVDEHALLECASMTEHCIEHPKYYREDHSDGLDVAALSSSSNHSTPDEETSPSRSHCSSTSPDTANRSFPVFGRTSGPGYVRVPRKSSVGTSSTSRHLDPYAPNDEHLAMSSRPVGYSCGPGSAVDVMDDPVLKRQALLSLRVTALQQLRGAGTDDTASQSNADMEDPPFGMGDSFRLLSPVSAASSPKRHRWMTIRRLTSILQARQSKRCQNSADMESSTGSGPPMELSNTSSPMDLFQALLSNSDNLCVKALLAGSLAVGTVLSLTELTFSHLTPVASPFHVCPSTYCAWAVLCEKGAGTPSHSSINGAHTWSILLRGTKRWLVSHPLDKHLITDSTSGKVAHLQSMNNERFPNAQYARIYSFTQQAGEAVFLPSDAVFFEESLEDTVSVLVNYMDETSELMYARNAREDSILLHQCEGEATAQRAELRPFTLVDIVISAPRSDQHQEDVCILRTLAEFERCSLPRCDLAARVELAGFHRSLGPVGRRMLQNSGKHAVGIPQGFFHTAKDHHLLLSYTSTHKDLQQLRDAISSLPTQPYLSLLNPTHNPRCERYFHHIPTASSMFGCIPKYPPLSVLLNQKWPFEKELCRNLVTIPRIILSKLHSPMGFLRPGSVWHYSRFDSLKGTSSGSLQRQLSCFGADLEAALPSSLDADDWCRTFLFYCNPLFEEPVALHPRVVGATFQEGKEVLQTTTNPDARLRIVEFEWNPNCLEKFGSLKLLQILGRGFPCLPEELADESDEESLGSTELDSEASDTLSNHVGLHLGGGNSSSVNDFIKRVVMHDSHLPRFQEWMVAHHLNPDKCGDPEMYMTPVLWSLCRARVVGYASPMQHESNCTSAEHDAEHPGGCSPSLLSESFGRSTSEYFERCYETVCLAGSAASALLIHKHDSPYASMATSLCNWLCDRTLEGDYAGADLLALMESVVLHGSSEEQAILSEVLKIKRRQSMDVNQSKLHELEMICDVLV